jgi:hypothetical protein
MCQCSQIVNQFACADFRTLTGIFCFALHYMTAGPNTRKISRPAAITLSNGAYAVAAGDPSRCRVAPSGRIVESLGRLGRDWTRHPPWIQSLTYLYIYGYRY